MATHAHPTILDEKAYTQHEEFVESVPEANVLTPEELETEKKDLLQPYPVPYLAYSIPKELSVQYCLSGSCNSYLIWQSVGYVFRYLLLVNHNRISRRILVHSTFLAEQRLAYSAAESRSASTN